MVMGEVNALARLARTNSLGSPNLKGFTIYNGTRDFGTAIQPARTQSFSPPGMHYISGKKPC